MINTIYLDRNFYRSSSSIFAHLVEVMGGLSLLASEKERPGVIPQKYVPKAIAWWLALCGKVGVRSVEDLIWSKFPRVCSYCRLPVHKNDVCLEAKRELRTPNWAILDNLAQENMEEKPRTVQEWQAMFAEIYPVVATEDYSATFARFTEELGELAEALRAFPVAPAYFLGEAADVFAWLMHLQNLIESKTHVPLAQRGKALVKEFSDAYPNSCSDCGNPICTCPPILPSTLGRIGHEVPRSKASFLPGGALLPIDEAMEQFELRARELRIGDKSYPADPKLIREIHQIVSQLKEVVLENKQMSGSISAGLVDVLSRIEMLTSSQRVTQESIESLAHAIAELPSESRTAILGFLSNIAAGPWVAALLEMIKMWAT